MILDDPKTYEETTDQEDMGEKGGEATTDTSDVDFESEMNLEPEIEDVEE